MDTLMHALHVDNLGGDGQTMEPAMALALSASFGSVERWREAFIAMAKAQGGGSGWLLLTFQPREGMLVNHRAADHTQALAGGVPILVLDRHEHTANIAWAPVYQRYQDAVHAASEPFGAPQEDVGSSLVFDVRRAGVFDKAPSMIPGARWCDPASVGQWASELPADRDIVVYCVYGHEVGRVTAMRLRAAGLRARYLRGGIDAWQAAGQPLAPKGAPGGEHRGSGAGGRVDEG